MLYIIGAELIIIMANLLAFMPAEGVSLTGNVVSEEVFQELKKVTWPTRQELLQATAVVIITTFIIAIFVAMVDAVISLVMRILFR